MLPSDKILAHGMPPMHCSPVFFIREVLIKQMIVSLKINQSHRVIHPVAYRRKMYFWSHQLYSPKYKINNFSAISCYYRNSSAFRLHCSYYFTAPSVIPATKYFCRHKKTITRGIQHTRTAGKISSQGLPYWPAVIFA